MVTGRVIAGHAMQELTQPPGGVRQGVELLRDLARAPPKVAQDLSASAEVRKGTLDLRDFDREAAGCGATIREDCRRRANFSGRRNK